MIKNQKLIKQKRIYPVTEKFFDKKYAEKFNKENNAPVGITDREFRTIIIRELLGIDWFVVDPLEYNQVTEVALFEILDLYSPKKK